MDKKGQGISINVVIVAAIALLVLVVLSVIFLGRFEVFSGKSRDCATQGGTCVAGACPAGYRSYPVWSCPSGQSCCIVGG